jgi:hypothetical protein
MLVTYCASEPLQEITDSGPDAKSTLQIISARNNLSANKTSQFPVWNKIGRELSVELRRRAQHHQANGLNITSTTMPAMVASAERLKYPLSD